MYKKIAEVRQLVQNGNFESADNWYGASLMQVSNNIMTIAMTSSTLYCNIYNNGISFSLNHIYFVDFKFSRNTVYSTAAAFNLGGTIKSFTSTDTLTRYSFIQKATNVSYVGLYFYPYGPGQVSEYDATKNAQLSNVMVIDLTEMYGAGNEPITVEQFKADYPNDYYPYAPQTWVNYNRTKFICPTKNLLAVPQTEVQPSNTAFDSTTKRIFPLNGYIKGIARNNYYAPNDIDLLNITNSSITVRNRNSGYGVAIPLHLQSNKSFTVQANADINSAIVGISFYQEDGTLISFMHASGNHIVKAFTTPANCYYTLISFAGTINVTYTFSNIQLEEGSTATSYVPYGYLPIRKTKFIYTIDNEYQEVEYLESTGTQWIDSGWVPHINPKFETKIQVTSASSDCVLGLRRSNDRRDYFGLWTNGNIAINYAEYDSGYISSTNVTQAPHIIKNDNVFLYRDGILVNSVASIKEYIQYEQWNVYLFCLHQANNTAGRFSKVKIFYCKFYDNNTLVRNFIPCYRKTDNKPGMYDLITKQFFTNQGSGEFILGQEVRYRYLPYH